MVIVVGCLVSNIKEKTENIVRLLTSRLLLIYCLLACGTADDDINRLAKGAYVYITFDCTKDNEEINFWGRGRDRSTELN